MRDVPMPVDPALFAAFLVASAVVIVAPGPDILYVAARSLGQGRAAGLVASCGTCTGLVLHGTAAALGLSSLFAHAPLAYEVLRWLGVAYLAYLAWRALTARDDVAPPAAHGGARHGWARIYGQAMLTNLLNPKIVVFFIAFLPQFVAPRAAPYAVQIAVLVAVFTLLGFLFLALLAVSVGRLGDRLRTLPRFQRVQRWVMGTTLGGLAAWLAVSGRR